MGLLDAVPKNPKVEDLLPVFDQLDRRVATLEAYVGRNDERITQLETYAAQVIAERGRQIDALEQTVAEHQEGAVKRQQEVDQLRAETGRVRWSLRTGRRP